MSNFICEHCGKAILNSPRGYTTECKHYKLKCVNGLSIDKKEIDRKVKLWTKQNKLKGGK
jgi:hypothetical protein